MSVDKFWENTLFGVGDLSRDVQKALEASLNNYWRLPVQLFNIGDTVTYTGRDGNAVVTAVQSINGEFTYNIRFLGLTLGGPPEERHEVPQRMLLKVSSYAQSGTTRPMPKYSVGQRVWYDEVSGLVENFRWEGTRWLYKVVDWDRWVWESDLSDEAPEEEEVDVTFDEWWKNLVATEAPTIRKKAEEYGSNSLEEIGKLFDRASDSGFGAHPLETGCFIYAFGKMQRVADAMLKGDKPSEDTWKDLMVYSAMALYIRQHGRWP